MTKRVTTKARTSATGRKKLALSKETLRDLSAGNMRQVRGGVVKNCTWGNSGCGSN